MYDVCVVGHVTKDRIQVPGRPDREMAGGTAYYVARAWASLGLSVCLVTRVAEADAGDLLGELGERGVHVRNLGSRDTTVFENTYDGPALQNRTQRVLAVADPLRPQDLAGVSARAVHVGPLTRGEVDPELFEHLHGVAPYVSLDGQGLLRQVVDQRVVLAPYRELHRVLPRLNLLKVDDREAEIMVGAGSAAHLAAQLADAGVQEVLLTFADRGSAVLSDACYQRIAAVAPRETVDATGCGDTYVAGYIFARLRHHEPQAAARFASAAASLKIADYGPFVGTEAEVWAHLNDAEGRPGPGTPQGRGN